LTSSDPGEAFTNHPGVHELSIFQKDISRPPTRWIAWSIFVFDPDPTLGEQSGQALPGFTGRSGGGVELATDFRGVDTQQLNAADTEDIDCVTIDNVAHHDRRRTALRDREEWGEKPRGQREGNEFTRGVGQAETRGRSHAGVSCNPASTAFNCMTAPNAEQNAAGPQRPPYQAAIPDRRVQSQDRSFCYLDPRPGRRPQQPTFSLFGSRCRDNGEP
jgi:hypothetical protein